MTQPIKNAAEHLASLQDGRTVYLDGAVVEDVTTDKAFANSVRSAAALYDYQADPANAELMTFASPNFFCTVGVNDSEGSSPAMFD